MLVYIEYTYHRHIYILKRLFTICTQHQLILCLIQLYDTRNPIFGSYSTYLFRCYSRGKDVTLHYHYIYIYIYIYIVYMWQKSSVFSHESAQRNVAGHLIDKMSLKQHGYFATNGFVFPLIRQMLMNHSYYHTWSQMLMNHSYYHTWNAFHVW